jgi:hypothetical protein
MSKVKFPWLPGSAYCPECGSPIIGYKRTKGNDFEVTHIQHPSNDCVNRGKQYAPPLIELTELL